MSTMTRPRSRSVTTLTFMINITRLSNLTAKLMRKTGWVLTTHLSLGILGQAKMPGAETAHESTTDEV